MENAIKHFRLDGQPCLCEAHGCGHINRTYLVRTDTGRQYILQKISRTAFLDADGLMKNVAAVTEHIRKQTDDPRECLRLVPTLEGENYFRDGEGEVWRLYDFIENSLCLQTPEQPSDFYESAIAFGRFQNQLADFPVEKLCETIPDFHNTPDRYRKLRAAIDADVCGRAASAREEIAFALAREQEAGTLQRMREDGSLPLRVTHNDTKLNNVMLDAVTRKALCVIDLDTVMPGLAAYDFGDSIRFGASTAAEDEKDLDKVEMSLGAFETFSRGFLTACSSLTALERETLPMGAKLMTLECGIRFLTDYLEGDRYFSIHRPEHNLDRTRTQFKLVADMEKKWAQMHSVIRRLSGEREWS